MQPSAIAMPTTPDRDLVTWVHKAALVLLMVFVPLVGLVFGKKAVLGYGLGGALSIAVLWSHQWLVGRIFDRGARGVRRLLVAVWLLKYPALAAILYFAVSRQAVSPAGLLVGLGLVPFAITIKVLGGGLRGGGPGGER